MRCGKLHTTLSRPAQHVFRRASAYLRRVAGGGLPPPPPPEAVAAEVEYDPRREPHSVLSQAASIKHNIASQISLLSRMDQGARERDTVLEHCRERSPQRRAVVHPGDGLPEAASYNSVGAVSASLHNKCDELRHFLHTVSPEPAPLCARAHPGPPDQIFALSMEVVASIWLSKLLTLGDAGEPRSGPTC